MNNREGGAEGEAVREAGGEGGEKGVGERMCDKQVQLNNSAQKMSEQSVTEVS